MSVDTSPVRLNAAGVTASGQAPTSADREQVARLAREFEAMLMTQMVREMRKAMLPDEEDTGGLGMSAMTDIGDVEFGRSLSSAGGFGLSQVLMRALDRQFPGATGVSTPSSPTLPTAGSTTGVSAAPTAAPDAVDPDGGAAPLGTPATGPVSSGFGWRQDPLTGARRFHSGVDIAAAFGRDVTAAAPGQVMFAGVQGGYGQTVVVDHGNGRQTRYAHLSQQMVQAGDQVEAGQLLGKTGDSGRVTGPHLHFEVLVDGRPVDPLAADQHGSRRQPI